jgi:hypothetical protein
MGALSGGEQRFLRIAAALSGSDTEVNLGYAMAGLDRAHLHLVLAGVAHASGSHEQQELTFRPDGTAAFTRPGTIYRWDQTEPETACRPGGIGR